MGVRNEFKMCENVYVVKKWVLKMGLLCRMGVENQV